MRNFCIVFVLIHIAFCQTNLIQSFLDPSKYLVNVTKVDYCSNATLNACQNKDCIDGLNPPYGYTCKKPDGTSLQVDYVSNQIYVQISSFLSSYNTLLSIQDIVIDDTAATLTYTYQTTTTFTSIASSFIFGYGQSAISSSSQSLLGFMMPTSRINLTPSTTVPQLTLEFLFPSASTTVTWLSSTIGDPDILTSILLTNSGLNASSTADRVRLLVYNDTTNTVYNMWLEDIAQDPGVDTTYIGNACVSYGKLLNGSTDVSSSGYILDKTTLTIDDTSCIYLPPAPGTNNPSPGSPGAPGMGSGNTLTCSAFLMVCFLICLIFQ